MRVPPWERKSLDSTRKCKNIPSYSCCLISHQGSSSPQGIRPVSVAIEDPETYGFPSGKHRNLMILKTSPRSEVLRTHPANYMTACVKNCQLPHSSDLVCDDYVCLQKGRNAPLLPNKQPRPLGSRVQSQVLGLPISILHFPILGSKPLASSSQGPLRGVGSPPLVSILSPL